MQTAGATHDGNGPLVGYLRALRGISRQQLAGALGWSVSHLTNVERGRHRLTESKAREVALLFGIADLRILFGPPVDEMPDEEVPVFPQGLVR